ncbi:hypothetical protein DMX05_03595 [Pseudomonas soli]|nr:hypothetical protein DMX05_03595 [Pseudomonas soli]
MWPFFIYKEFTDRVWVVLPVTEIKLSDCSPAYFFEEFKEDKVLIWFFFFSVSMLVYPIVDFGRAV